MPNAFFVDIESNLGGNPRDFSLEEIAQFARALRRALAPEPADLVVLACNPRIAGAVHAGWPDANLFTGHGKNGADNALIRVAQSPGVLAPADTVWVCGADGDLLPIVEAAHGARRRTMIACAHSHCSRRLSRAAHGSVNLAIRPRRAGCAR
jgi:hypothetical protein